METIPNPPGVAADAVARELLTTKRLRILRDLSRLDRTVPIETLTEQVTEGGGDADARRTRLALLHADLPVLERGGLVELHRSRGTVARRFDIGGVEVVCRRGERFIAAVEGVATESGRRRRDRDPRGSPR